MSHVHTNPVSRLAGIIASLPFYSPEEKFETIQPRWVGQPKPLRTLSASRVQRKEADMANTRYLTAERPAHQMDPLLAKILREDATIDLSATNTQHEWVPPRLPNTQPEDHAFGFTAEECMEEYMETQQVVVADQAVVEVLQIEDEFVHQLVRPTCLVTQAVVLLRLLEDDIRMMETVKTMSVSDAVPLNAERVWGSKLNALVNTGHCKLATVLHEIKREGKINQLQDALDRMNYSNAYNHETKVLSLRHKEHAQYGMITI